MVFELVDPELIRTYRLNPIIANHYSADIAFQQKFEALLNRNISQARDIFDMHLLLPSGAHQNILPDTITT